MGEGGRWVSGGGREVGKWGGRRGLEGKWGGRRGLEGKWGGRRGLEGKWGGRRRQEGESVCVVESVNGWESVCVEGESVNGWESVSGWEREWEGESVCGSVCVLERECGS